MKRILVTGASGFLGCQVLPLLVSLGYEVHGVARELCRNRGPVIWHSCDLLTGDCPHQLMKQVRPTHLLHLAWCASPGNFWGTLENLRWLKTTVALFEAFAEQGGKRAVGVGTCAEYAWNSDGQPLSETCSPTVPSTLYGRAKLTACHFLSTLNAAGLFSSAWARLFFLYGPGGHCNRMPGAIIASLLNGQPALCSSGVQLRDYLYITDAAAALVALLNSGVEGPVNVASGQSVRILDIAQETSRILNGQDLLKVGALADSTHNNPSEIVADITRLTDEVRMTPQVSLKEGLQLTIDWWQQIRRSNAA